MKPEGLGRSPFFSGYLVFTALVSGAAVMVLEVLGAKVLGPVFGVSLIVWTSLVAVTLLALALGYAAGGLLSDRKGSPDFLYGILLASGLLVLVVPLMKSAVLMACLPLGLRTGSLASASLLFGPPLFLLGCVSPYVVKIAARELRSLGRTVGALYAVSTAGSFVGTLLAGFFLIAYLGVGRIFDVVGIVLISLGAVYFLIFRGKWQLLMFALAPVLLPGNNPEGSKVFPDGARLEAIFSRDTFYGNLKVMDFSRGSLSYRMLLIDGQTQGAVDMGAGDSVSEYTYVLAFLPYAVNPLGKDCLVLGMGAGIVPAWFEKRGMNVDVVEINRDMAHVARKYFGFEPRGEVYFEDARYHLNRSGKSYDYLIVDVFNGDTTPSHLLGVEAFRLMKSRLAEGGVLALNLMGSLREDVFITASVVKTLKAVFRTVEVHPLFHPDRGEGIGNLVVVAYDFPAVAVQPGFFQRFSVHPAVEFNVREALARDFTFSPDAGAIVLSDEYNPIDYFDIRLKERLRVGIMGERHFEMIY